MDLLKVIFDLKNIKTTCFLCLKEHKNTYSIFDDIEIRDKYFNFNISISGMMKNLFPSHDIILSQACDNCSDLIIKMYMILHKNNMNKMLFGIIIDNFEKELHKKTNYNKVNQMCRMKIDLPKYEDILKGNKHPVISEDNDKNTNVSVERCGTCSMNFSSRELLLEHNNITHRNTNEAIICDTCGKVCRTPNTLKAHLNCHKEKQCPYCSKTLKTHSHYKIHLNNHQKAVKRIRKRTYYNCNDCNYKSLNKTSLQAHINKVHLNIKPYVCQICYKGFYKKSNLTEHGIVHEKVKNETCEVCGDNFVNKKTLFEHLRLHKDERPYQCDICNKSFVTSGRRSDHIKRKHMEKTEYCLLCNKKYSLRKELNRHMKKVHWSDTVVTDTQFIDPNTEPSFNYIDSNIESILPIT